MGLEMGTTRLMAWFSVLIRVRTARVVVVRGGTGAWLALEGGVEEEGVSEEWVVEEGDLEESWGVLEGGVLEEGVLEALEEPLVSASLFSPLDSLEEEAVTLAGVRLVEAESAGSSLVEEAGSEGLSEETGTGWSLASVGTDCSLVG